ncbi:MAG: hypothetical protein IT556_17765, partial [Acetobacteraceae bacterium]|nr:hypothetical protein [Acetobacteraceae bacterium]
MSRRARLLVGTAWLAGCAALLVPGPGPAQTSDQLDWQTRTLRQRQRLWEPREVRRAVDEAASQARIAPGSSGAPGAAAVPGAPPLPQAPPGSGLEELPWTGTSTPGQALSPGQPPPLVAAPQRPSPPATAPDRNAPVTFTAGTITYDEQTQTVTATGRVEAWQNDRVLQADRVTFERGTG